MTNQTVASPAGADARGPIWTTVQAFLEAVASKDATACIDCFDDEVAAFLPRECYQDIIRSRRRLELAWLEMLPLLEPNLDFRPIDWKVDYQSGDAALATFAMKDGTSYCRRTILLVRRGQQWKIRHLHASNFPAAPTPWPWNRWFLSRLRTAFASTCGQHREP